FTLAEAQAARRGTRVEFLETASAAQRRYVFWLDEGQLIVAKEPEFTPRVVASGEAGVVTRAFAVPGGRTIFFIRNAELRQIDVAEGAASRLVASGGRVPVPLAVFSDRAFVVKEDKVLYEYRRNPADQWQRHQVLQTDDRHAAAIDVGSVVYSPDGTQLAFVSHRKQGQSYVAIHDIAKDETRYLQPSIFRDQLPVWSPDGNELAFVRVPGNWTRNYRFTPQREGAPWNIVAANARTGVLRTIWTADPGPGSVATTVAPLWLADGRILFSWEKTGWNLLYAVPARGGAATLLTPGEGEIDSLALSADGRTLVYDSNIGDLGRRHVWSLALAGGEPKALTSGRGVEKQPQFTAGGFLLHAVSHSESGAPHLAVRTPQGAARTVALPSTEVARQSQSVWSQFVPPDVIQVRAEDGVVGHHVLLKPKRAAPPEGYPAIIYAHGGPTQQTLPGGGRYEFAQYVASQGYLFVDINYRGSTGLGLNFRLPAGRGATGGSELADVSALLKYLKARGDVNSRRLAIVGASYGGHIVGLAMTQLADQFAAGVSLFGVADWVVEMQKDENAPPTFIRLAERTQIEEQAYLSSPTSRIEQWRAPTLFTMGDLDTQGHMESLIDLGYQLLAQGTPVEFYVDPEGRHGLFPQQRVFEFLQQHLK
ncbi:S9 family peptidase, partial [Steroidobacter sp.]|uniref:S9 family peptidase n=1 Tax=Steroidobacter sp. TaxID=1978227 RepID=UPI001A547948